MPDTGLRNDPYSAFRFRVDIDGLPGGFSECSGLTLETEVQDFPEGGENEFVHRLPSRVKQANITLKRGIVGIALWQWFAASLPGQVALKSGSIQLLDGAGAALLTWNFERGFPRKIDGPTLNSAQSSLAIESLEICHHGLTVNAGGG